MSYAVENEGGEVSADLDDIILEELHTEYMDHRKCSSDLHVTAAGLVGVPGHYDMHFRVNYVVRAIIKDARLPSRL